MEGQVFNAWTTAGAAGEEERAGKRSVLPFFARLEIWLIGLQATDPNGLRPAKRRRPGG